MKRNVLYMVALLGFCAISAQSYKSGYRTDVCACLESESLKRSITENTLKACLRKVLPKYADKIDAQIDEPDVRKKFQKGQIARRDLLVAMSYELIYTCDVYFKHIEDQRRSAKLITRENTKESELERYNQMVALKPNAMSYYMRAQLHFNLGNIKEAEADLNKSLEVNPYKDNVKHTRHELFLLAWVYEEQEKYAEAVELYNKIYMGYYDQKVAKLRALADRKAGGTIANAAKMEPSQTTKDNTNAARRRTSETNTAAQEIKKKVRSNTESRAVKVKTKKDTAALRKLLKIGG